MGFLSHSRTEPSLGAPRSGGHGRSLGWAPQSRTTLEAFSSDRGCLLDSRERFPKVSITHIPDSPNLVSAQRAGRAEQVLWAAHKSLRLRTLPQGFCWPDWHHAKAPTACPGPGVSWWCCGSLLPSLPLCRDAASREMSHT